MVQADMPLDTYQHASSAIKVHHDPTFSSPSQIWQWIRPIYCLFTSFCCSTLPWRQIQPTCRLSPLLRCLPYYWTLLQSASQISPTISHASSFGRVINTIIEITSNRTHSPHGRRALEQASSLTSTQSHPPYSWFPPVFSYSPNIWVQIQAASRPSPSKTYPPLIWWSTWPATPLPATNSFISLLGFSLTSDRVRFLPPSPTSL